jgi:hypothetical protein
VHAACGVDAVEHRELRRDF